MTGRPAKQRHWLAQRYADERAREDAEATDVQRQHELRKRAGEAQERRRQRAEDLISEWSCVGESDRETTIAVLRHDAVDLRDDGELDLARAYEVAAELLEVVGHA